MRNIIFSFILLGGLLGLVQTKSCFDQPINSKTNSKKKISKINTIKFTNISKTCAPWDGEALTIFISDKMQVCDDIKSPFLNITIWKGLTDVSGKTYTFPDQKLGRIFKSVSEEKYVELKAGTISFEKSDDKSEVFFEIDLEFEDGEKVKDAFKAKWCSNEYICG